MLPSKGYFSQFNCPYFDADICERPHCHFKHSKKDKETSVDSKADEVEYTDSDILKHLVKETVKQVLNERESDLVDTSDIVDNVVQTITTPKLNKNEIKLKKDVFSDVTPQLKPSYNPTPIAELTRRHIPVQYAPTKPSTITLPRKSVSASSTSDNMPTTLGYVPKSKCLLSDVNTYKPYFDNVGSTSSPYEPDCTTYIPSQVTYAPTKITDVIESVDGYNPAEIYENGPSKFSCLNSSNSQTPITYVPSVIVHKPSEKNETLDEVSEKQKSLELLINMTTNDSYEVSSVVLSSTSKECISEKLINHVEDSIEKIDEINKIERENEKKSEKEKSKSSSSSKYNNHQRSKSKSKSNSSSVSHKPEKEISKSSTHSTNENKCKSYSDEKSSRKSHSKSKSGKSMSEESEPEQLNKINNNKLNNVEEKVATTLDGLIMDSSSEKLKVKRDTQLIKLGQVKKKRPMSDSNLDVHNHCNKKSNYSSDNSEEILDVNKKKSISNRYKIHNNNGSCSSSGSSCGSHKSILSSSNSEKIRKPNHDERPTSSEKRKRYSHIKKKEKNTMGIEDGNSSSSDLEVLLPERNAYIEIDDSSSNNSTFDNSEITSTNKEVQSDGSHCPKKRRLSIGGGSLPNLPAVPPSMCERWRKAREHVQKSNLSGKLRISSVPNVSSLLNAKDKLLSRVQRPLVEKKSEKSYSDMLPAAQISKRVAHVSVHNDYPKCEASPDIKLPLPIRQVCMNTMFDTFLQFHSPHDAKIKAIETELHIARRTQIARTYQNSMAVALLRIRKNKGDTESDNTLNSFKETEGILKGTTAQTVPAFTYGVTLYDCFNQYKLHENEFVENGFPLPHPTRPGCAYIEKSARRAKHKQPSDPNQRICSNCSSIYFVDDDGFPLNENDCTYHWGKLYRIKANGSIQERYRCCNADVGSEPCVTGRYHVCCMLDEDCMEDFYTTSTISSKPQVYAIDCEMCITKSGYELARCTIVGLDGSVVLDTVILPSSKVLDYCTRFSGITEDMIRDCTTTFDDFRKDFLKLIHKNTVLVGHSLENDFKVLKIIHKTVVDTSVVFPHKLGLPYKMALRTLVKEKLHLTIQDKESGHDSKEDAVSCLKLMYWKIKEDAKKRKPRVIISIDKS